MLSNAVIILVCHYTVFIQYAISLLGQFYRNLELPELDKIQTIKELLRVKYGLVSLPLFDVSQINFMTESLCTQ